MKVYLTKKYKEDLQRILLTSKEKFGEKVEEELYVEVRKLLVLVSNDPKIGIDKYNKKGSEFILRCFRVKGFPFLMFYSIDEALKQVNVYRLLHESMDIPNLNLF